MLRHYCKIAWRSLSRQKGLAIINVCGLSVGIMCFVLLLLYSVNELSFDRFHKNEKDIYRVFEWTTSKDGNDQGSVSMPMPLGPALKKDMPDIVNYARLKQAGAENFMRFDNEVHRVHVSFADPQFFSIFTFPLKYGSPATALSSMNGLVITETKAKELFGNDEVTGKTVEIKVDDVFQSFVIRAVAHDIPVNSSIRFEVMGSFAFLETTRFGNLFNNWYTTSFRTYVQLRPGSSLPTDALRLSNFHRQYNPEEEVPAKRERPLVTYGLQPLHTIHTNTKLSDSSGIESIDLKTIWIILSIAAGVLFIACINFTTLAIGRSVARSTEVGIRKVIGAARRQLIFQFLTEAVLLSVFSTIFGLILAILCLPYFNRFSGRDLQFSMTLYPEMGWMLPGLVLLVGLLSGSYPALLLSHFRPVDILKNKIHAGGSNLFTKSLVALQFALSIGLIISTVIILQQTSYMTAKNPGFNKENVIVVEADQTDTKKIYPLFKRAVNNRSGITGVAGAETGLGEGTDLDMHGFMYHGNHKALYEYLIDPDYINVLGMQLIAGRNFSYTISDDTLNSVIINETAMQDLGWTIDNVIGQKITGYTNSKSPVVIGVVRNFNFQPLTEKIQPQLFHQFVGHYPRKFFVRMQPGSPAPLLAFLKKTWDKLAPEAPFKFSFLDENLDSFYKSERRWTAIIGWAGGISIFLACLGLFGLTALAAIKRTREIGIRKVFGATVLHIVTLISKDFLKLVLIALVIASPMVWYFMNHWLQEYAYRITIQVWVFAGTGLAVLLIAILTVCFQAVKAAYANPVKSLRTE